MQADGVVDAPGLAEGLFIGEADDSPAEGFDLNLSEVVPRDDLVPAVNTAVDLDNQLKGRAGEIDDEGSDRMLAPHLPAIDHPAA